MWRWLVLYLELAITIHDALSPAADCEVPKLLKCAVVHLGMGLRVEKKRASLNPYLEG